MLGFVNEKERQMPSCDRNAERTVEYYKGFAMLDNYHSGDALAGLCRNCLIANAVFPAALLQTFLLLLRQHRTMIVRYCLKLWIMLMG